MERRDDMSKIKILALAMLLAASTVLATEAQASFSPDSFNPQPEPPGWNPHPEPPGLSPQPKPQPEPPGFDVDRP
jgi:hypothetical protein